MFGLPLGWFIGLILLAIFFLNWIKVLNEYERGVIFRFGKLLPYPKGPGLIFVFSPIDRMVKISLRLVALDVPPQDVITRDNVSVKGKRGGFLPCRSSDQGGGRGGELSPCDFSACANDAPQRPRSSGAR